MNARAAAIGDIDADVANQIVTLCYRYVQALDDRDLDAWPQFFTEDGRYIIHPRENRDQGLEGYWIYCDSRAMMEDRVLSTKEVNLYNIHHDRHLISNIVIEESGENRFGVRSNYMVVQTDVEGRSAIFSVGEYRDWVTLEHGQPLFAERVVIPDTFAISPLLAIPL